MKKFAYFTIMVFLITACGEKLPIKEMLQARMAISKAESVKAEKYAEEEFTGAKNKLLECHDKVKKEEDIDNVKKTAEESTKLAVMAYVKAVPLLAKDIISIAEKSLEEARELYAEQLAKDEFKDADDELKKANDLFQNKKYYEAYLSAVEADKKAKNARNVAMGKKDVLRDSIAEVKNVLEEAKKYGAETNSPTKYNSAKENLGTAEKSYESLELKKGFAAVELAKKDADDAFLESIQKSANDKILTAEDAINKAEKSPNAKKGQDELLAAKESLGNAKSALADSKYKESIAASEEAIRLANKVFEVKESDDKKIASDDTEKKVPEKIDQEDSDKDYVLYTVKYRERYKDCLWRIAGKFYKNPYLWKTIYEANKDKINNPHLIYPGWVLKVPKLKK